MKLQDFVNKYFYWLLFIALFFYYYIIAPQKSNLKWKFLPLLAGLLSVKMHPFMQWEHWRIISQTFRIVNEYINIFLEQFSEATLFNYRIWQHLQWLMDHVILLSNRKLASEILFDELSTSDVQLNIIKTMKGDEFNVRMNCLNKIWKAFEKEE